MWKFGVVGIVILVVVAIGFSMIEGRSPEIGAQAQFLALSVSDLTGYERATDPYDWRFPRDHGAHETFQTEWWYYTGNLATEDGRHFGYQFTVFRRAITPQQNLTVDTESSEWRTNQVYMAHFTVSDIATPRFFHDERYSRGGAGLAFALPSDIQPDAGYQVTLENWTVEQTAPEVYHITAQSEQGFGVDFTLDQARPPALHGDNGLSPKSPETGNASYYYSLSRLETSGTINIDGEAFDVTGTSWMDHEFSTSALGLNALGWDWFGLQFDDGRDLMVGKIRLLNGGREPAFGGLLVEADGSTIPLASDAFEIEATGEWTSPHTGATYPAGWTITVDAEAIGAEDDLRFSVTPLADDQELNSGAIAYWEGAVQLSGDVTGYGYAELTGYASTMTGRF
jgi:predicted secreted hydrolase